MTRTTYSTDGKKLTFSYDGEYFLPDTTDKKTFFKDRCGNAPFIVAYTTLINGGRRLVERYGLPEYEYDNGYVGYQHFQGFNTLEDAKKVFSLCKHLSRKYNDAYCDVFLIDVNK